MSVPSVARGPAGILLLGFAFVLLALATRLPFRDTTLFISDSGRYAMALERYDITVGRPHPPGNPLYVGAAKAIDAVVHDPPASLALLSAVLSGVAFLFAYLLGRDVGGEPAGWLAAVILPVSPLFWFFGGVDHAVDRRGRVLAVRRVDRQASERAAGVRGLLGAHDRARPGVRRPFNVRRPRRTALGLRGLAPPEGKS